MKRDAVRHVILISRLLIGTTLLIAAIAKSLDSGDFLLFLHKMGLAANIAIFVFSVTIFLEYALGILCLLGLFEKWIFLLVGLLFAGFGAIIYLALDSNIGASCGCFGGLVKSNISEFAMYRNFAVALFCAFASLHKQSTFSIDKYLRRTQVEE